MLSGWRLCMVVEMIMLILVVDDYKIMICIICNLFK